MLEGAGAAPAPGGVETGVSSSGAVAKCHGDWENGDDEEFKKMFGEFSDGETRVAACRLCWCFDFRLSVSRACSSLFKFWTTLAIDGEDRLESWIDCLERLLQKRALFSLLFASKGDREACLRSPPIPICCEGGPAQREGLREKQTKKRGARRLSSKGL